MPPFWAICLCSLSVRSLNGMRFSSLATSPPLLP
nr:MAG TPA: hypothetical protein [Caudoviricetes sp.]